MHDAELPRPREDEVGVDVIRSRYHGDRRAWRERRRDHLSLERLRPRSLPGSVRSHASRLAFDDKIRNVQEAVMMSSAMRVALAKRKRRREAETIWL